MKSRVAYNYLLMPSPGFQLCELASFAALLTTLAALCGY